MERDNYPALYRKADTASLEAQRKYLSAIRWQIFLLMCGAGLSIKSMPDAWYSVTNAAIFIAAIGVSILIANRNYEKSWYGTRALAESVKTSTWRFMMKSEPFHSSEDTTEAKRLFLSRIREISNSNNQTDIAMNGSNEGIDQVTVEMQRIRALSLDERKRFYLDHRIKEQADWYSIKATLNKRRSSQFFIILIILQVLAVLSVLFQIGFPEWEFWPTNILAVSTTGIMTWIQLKRYREIAASYSLTANEIGIIKGELEDAENDDEFADFVSDAENAFSREHTQWIAKHER